MATWHESKEGSFYEVGPHRFPFSECNLETCVEDKCDRELHASSKYLFGCRPKKYSKQECLEVDFYFLFSEGLKVGLMKEIIDWRCSF